ncbi:hypothetical protein CPB86DRAFT_818586 [Serendipita vermifera]|nr:hypothetical protein CPB86DRAFT_818586 [Serendipita vermifera]
MVSAISTTITKRNINSVSIDFVATSIYSLAAMGNLQLRLCSNCDYKNDFQVKAALHISLIAFLFTLSTIFIGEMIYRNDDDRTCLSTGQWGLWKLFMWFFCISRIARYYQMLEFDMPALIGIDITFLIGSMMFELVSHSPNPPYGLIPVTKALKYILIYQILCMEMGVLRQDNVMFIWPTSTPSTGSKLSDMDQAMALVTAIIAIIAQRRSCNDVRSSFQRFNDRFRGDREGVGGDGENLVLPYPSNARNTID